MNNIFNYKHNLHGVDFCYSKTSVIDEREMHPYHEILYYIDGNSTLICENFSKKLRRGSLIFIPNGCYHFFRCEELSKFERLKISFSSVEGFSELIPADTSAVKIFDELDDLSIRIPDTVCKTLQFEEDKRDGALLLGSFFLLLSICSKDPIKQKGVAERDRLVSATLAYIDENLTKEIDTESIARAMIVSSSSLSHVFKQEMGISLHKYVTEKRMMLAKRLIEEGNNPTKIFSDCGYGDYSSFYKAYVKLFGHPPSKL